MKLIDVLNAMCSTAEAKVSGWNWKTKAEFCRIGNRTYFKNHPEWNDFEVEHLFAMNGTICIEVILEKV